MKIQIERIVLREALAEVSPLAGKNKLLPILNDVKIVVKGERLRLQTTDGQSTIRKYIRAIEVLGDDGSFCLECALFSKIINSIGDAVVTLETELNLMKVIHDKGVMEIPTANADEFPEVEEPDTATMLTVPLSTLKYAAKTGSPFLGTEELRKALMAIYCEVDGNKFTFCATDSSRLATDTIDIPESYDKTVFYIDAPTSKLLEKVTSDKDEAVVRVSEKIVSFRAGNTVLFSRMTEGRYPNFRSIIPQNFAQVCTINRVKFIESVQRTSLLCPVTNLIELDFSPTGVKISADNFENSKKSTERLECTTNGRIRIGVKAEYLVQALKAFDTEKIDMKMMSPQKPAVIRGEGDTGAVLLVMPMMLQE
jgi:DNA polymerase-3 subunit beta